MRDKQQIPGSPEPALHTAGPSASKLQVWAGPSGTHHETSYYEVRKLLHDQERKVSDSHPV